MVKAGSDEDLCLFVNRSGYGPFQPRWFARYIEEREASAAALVGTSINFSAHPRGQQRENSTHVQTYAYLADLATLRPLAGRFPAAKEVDRIALIDSGEIGLSQWILKQGGKLACLAWPGKSFCAEKPIDKNLPMADIKKTINDAPFIYKRGLNREYLGWARFQVFKRTFSFQSGKKRLRNQESVL